MNVLKWMTKMSDRELKYDLQCILDAAKPDEHKEIEQYRAARMRATGFQPGRAGANNHGNVRSVPKAVRSQVCECGCGQALPKLADRRRRFHSDACRKRLTRSSQIDSPGRNTAHDGSLSETSRVRELSPNNAVWGVREWPCQHRPDHGSCLPCYLATVLDEPRLKAA